MKHDYPAPFIIAPLSDHTHTFILLHGRGSNGPKFGQVLVEFAITCSAPSSADNNNGNSSILQQTFPTVKFIFPTAKKRRSTILKRIPINQWFDNYSLDDPSEREHLQVDGLRETTEVVHQLIRDEVEGGIPLERIVLGGLSQGCAASIYAMLTFDRGRLGGYIGMSGWFPFVKYVNGSDKKEKVKVGEDIIGGDEGFGINTHGIDVDDDFERKAEVSDEDESDEEDNEDEDDDDDDDETDDDDSDDDEEDKDENNNTGSKHIKRTAPPTTESTNTHLQRLDAIEALNFLRENIDFALIDTETGADDHNLSVLRTPVFLGHGEEDEKVSVKLGEQIRDALVGTFFMSVTWKSYAEFGHWYKVPEEIDDIVEFLRKNVEGLA
ncbi:hypothetical protein H072_11097 [Dactylellina haptotyla CBS 200.50]|uniref:Phospholipase/carboxylesterase/thioesterase domain-containing protein n=1 Tax=Dactylellina haptotyla (strain CBS 200.50) TaxID=1284197 RepID=S8B903_DACHA|nr:hypothetical protein H072_11097 [Dactylellina haptotyla CBS 200.50]